jgi:nicotinamidase-related amidase
MTTRAGTGVPGSGGPGQPGYLAVIDMQRVFAEPDSPWLAPRFAEIVDPIRRLAEALRPRVVFTRFVAPASPHGAWRAYYDDWPFALQPPGARIYELAEDFAATAGPTMDATTFSKWGPELAAKAGGGALVLAGVSTDCCVLSTALAAADAGTPVRVVADACAGASDESHAQALDIMRLYAPLVEVVSLADLLGAKR